MTDKRKGLKPKSRKLATTTKKNKLTANQWQNTPQQNLFMDRWTNPASPTFGHAYNSALEAGYSPRYAAIISTPTTNNNWISEYMNKMELQPEHIKNKLQEIALDPAGNSKSPLDSQLKALELLMKLHNIGEKNSIQNNIIMQPILGGQTSTTAPNNPLKNIPNTSK